MNVQDAENFSKYETEVELALERERAKKPSQKELWLEYWGI